MRAIKHLRNVLGLELNAMQTDKNMSGRFQVIDKKIFNATLNFVKTWT